MLEDAQPLFPKPPLAQQTLLACVREVLVMLDEEQRQHDAELAVRRSRHERKIAWMQAQQESGKTPTYREWSRMMDETGWPTEEMDASFRSRFERGARMARTFSRATACLLCLRAMGVSRTHLQEVHLLLQEVLRIRSARPLDNHQLLARMMGAIQDGVQSVQGFCERVQELPADVTSGQVTEMAVEQTRKVQPQEDGMQLLAESRHAQRTSWRDELCRVLQVALELAQALPSPSDEPDERAPIPPSAEELVAHLEAVLIMLREEISRYRSGRESLRLLLAQEENTRSTPRPIKPIGPMLERSRSIHLTALFGRCEEILLAQDPELWKPVRVTYESIAAFRVYRATKRWKETPEPEAPMTLEQIKADHDRNMAEMDRESAEREEKQLALLTAALEQARQFAAAARGN